ncbi:hypothetical protein T06_11689, partial [Trichinella sp. T6]
MGYRLFHIDKEKLSRELCDRETRGYVFCTPLLVTDRLMLIKSIFEEKNFSRKFQNFMGYRPAYFRRKKLHCSEISKKLFPDYCGRRTTEWTCSNMYIHSEFSIEIDLVDLFIELTREYEAWQKINRRLVERKQAQKAKITNNIKYIWNS